MQALLEGRGKRMIVNHTCNSWPKPTITKFQKKGQGTKSLVGFGARPQGLSILYANAISFCMDNYGLSG